MPNTLPLNIIADVTIITASPQVAAPTFNQGLVIGNSTAIPSYGTNGRVRQYLSGTWSTAMLNDGFTNTSAEYLAMQLYFSQSPAPQAGFVGRQDLTAISAMSIHSANPGTGYAVGDLFTVTQSGASFGQGRVSAIGAGGSVTAFTIFQQGTGYSVSNGLATTTNGAGSGLEIDITTIGESALQAVQACRAANAQWYPCVVCGSADADHIAISAWVLSQVGTIYLATVSDAAILNGTAGNAAITIFGAGSKRTWLQYSTTQGGLFPSQVNFVAAVMGQMMASNTQATNSAFTEKFSGGVPLVGVYTEPNLTASQITNIEGPNATTGPNVNLFLNYANSFNVLEQGTMSAPGVFFDQILNLDILSSNIQFAIMNLLTSVPKIPQTDAGQQLLIQAVESALEKSANTGFIAAGIWQGQNIINKIVPGQTLPKGYSVVSPKYATLSSSQIASRQAPPIYVALIESGAVHFVTIEVQVQV